MPRALPSDLADQPTAERRDSGSTEASTTFKSPLKALQRHDLRPLEAMGQTGAVFATLDGAAVAIVPLDDYRRMLSAALDRPVQTVAKAEWPRPADPIGLSTIERDPDVATFIRGQFRGGVTIAEIRDACQNTFGAERTPSHARIQRFRKALSRVR